MSNQSLNIQRLKIVAEALDELCPQTVFVGGAVLGFYVDHERISDVRATKDIDCVIDVVSGMKRNTLEAKLRELGFRNDVIDGIICRWLINGVTVDVITPDEKDLGFTNRWYKDVIVDYDEISLDDIKIRIPSVAGFLATKLEAFHDRGKNDYMMSHDFEDIVTLLDGCQDLEASIEASPEQMKIFIDESFSRLLQDESFQEQLHFQWNNSAIADDAAEAVKARMNRIVEIC